MYRYAVAFYKNYREIFWLLSTTSLKCNHLALSHNHFDPKEIIFVNANVISIIKQRKKIYHTNEKKLSNLNFHNSFSMSVQL